MRQLFRILFVVAFSLGLAACGGGGGSSAPAPSASYSLTYNDNLSDSGTAPVDATSYTSGQSVTVVGNPGGLALNGYSFAGWNTQADGSGTTYAQGQSFAMGSADVVLYARWSTNPTYTLSYDGNVYNSGSVPVDTTNYEEGQTVSVAGNSGTLTKAGYSFTGWNSAADGSGTGYAPNATFLMGTADLILYAQWTPNPTYTVTYDGNGFDGGSVPADTNNYEEGQTVSVLGNSGNLTQAGYSFVGWNSAADGSGSGYAQGQTFAMGAADVILYAQWSLNPTYSVTYDGNLSNGGTVPVDASTYEAGQTVTVAGNSGNLSKAGYSFVGWNSAADGSGTGYAAGGSFVMGTANVVLYARWTLNPTYTVTYDGNASDGGSAPTDSTNYETNQVVTVLGNSGNLTRAGYNFSGWNTAADGSGTGYTQGNTFLMGTANLTLYAQWTALPTYTVTYAGNTQTGGSVPVDATHYLQGQTVTVAANSGALVKNGYSFTGWNSAFDGSGVAYAPNANFVMGASNVILHAQWTLNPTYTLSYDGNTSTSGSAPTDTNHYEQGWTVTVAGNTGNLSKTGYSFTGWNSAADGSGTAYVQGNSFAMGTADVILYAQWSLNPTYRVTYDANGATTGTVPLDTTSYEQGQSVTVAANSGNLVKTGQSFSGWNTAADGSGSGYAANAAFAMGAADITLYAQWATRYSVTYDGNGMYTNSFSTVPVDTNTYEAGQVVTVLPATARLGNLSGHSGTGWNTRPDGKGSSYTQGSQFLMGAADVVLYVQWDTTMSYTIMYNANGGGLAPYDYTQYEVGDQVVVAGAISTYGSSFVGWNTAADGSGTTYQPNDTFLMTKSGIFKLYAQWLANPVPAVSYDGNGNNGGSVPTPAQNYAEGGTVKVLGNTGNLSKTGYRFSGWNTAADGSGTAYAPNASFAMGASDVVLYAQWTANPTYRVIYHGNSNTRGHVPLDTTGYEQGRSATVLANSGNLARGAYNFIGWNSAADGSGTDYTAGNSLVVGNVDVVLYAKWSPKLPSVLYQAGLHNGNMGSRSGANALCAAAKPAACSGRNKTHAFFSSYQNSKSVTLSNIPWETGIDPVTRIVGPNGLQISTDWAGLTDAGIDRSLTAAGVLPASTRWWSGTVISGTTFRDVWGCYNNSTSWAYSANNTVVRGITGSSMATANPTWFDDHTTSAAGTAVVEACSTQHYLLCVCGE